MTICSNCQVCHVCVSVCTLDRCENRILHVIIDGVLEQWLHIIYNQEKYFFSTSENVQGSHIYIEKLHSPSQGQKIKFNFLVFLLAHQQRLGMLIPKIYICPQQILLQVGEKLEKPPGTCNFPKIAISQRFFAFFTHLEQYLLWTCIHFWNQHAKALLMGQ